MLFSHVLGSHCYTVTLPSSTAEQWSSFMMFYSIFLLDHNIKFCKAIGLLILSKGHYQKGKDHGTCSMLSVHFLSKDGLMVLTHTTVHQSRGDLYGALSKPVFEEIKRFNQYIVWSNIWHTVKFSPNICQWMSTWEVIQMNLHGVWKEQAHFDENLEDPLLDTHGQLFSWTITDVKIWDQVRGHCLWDHLHEWICLGLGTSIVENSQSHHKILKP